MLARSMARIGAACILALTAGEIAARAESRGLSELNTSPSGKPERLSELLSRFSETPRVLTPSVKFAVVRSRNQTTSARTCRRGRRALLGALIGTAAAAPLAALAHKRWENEAANGAAAAATTLALGAAGGAFIGVATCGS
jgi:hypothetical protein